MKLLKTSLLAALGIPLTAALAHANAFNINEHDARVTGRGGASAATNVGASSIIFNPGGIAVSEGTQIAISGGAYFATGSYENATTGKIETDSDPAIVPSVFVTSRVNDMIAVGIGFHLPFGLAVSWPDGHPQSDAIQDQTLRTYYITPSIGVNLNKQVPGLSFGAGLDLVPATVELEQTITFGDTQGSARLGGDGFGVGFRAGVMYQPEKLKQLHFGVMYRSNVNIDFQGKGDFDIAEPFRGQLPPDGDIQTSITMPQSVWGGVAFDPIPALQLEVNAVWIDWSSFNELRIALPGGTESVAPQNYEDKVTFRFGAEYKIPSAPVAVRAGFVYDPTPIPTSTISARLPDVNRKNVSVGGSYFLKDYGVHAGVLWVTPGERETSDVPFQPQYKGTYGVTAVVATLMLTGTFGGGSAAPPPPADPTMASR